MAISDRINEMYTHVGDVYDTITNVDVNNGKNLFDYNKITTSAYYTNNYDGSFTRNSNGSSITINVDTASVPYDKFSLKAGTYSVSFDIKTTATVTLNNFFMCTKQNDTASNLAKSIGVQIPANTTTHIKAENYVVVNNAEKVGFAGYLSASTGVVISNIQVEKGTTASKYQPYTDNPTYKNIENIPSTIRKSYLDIMNNGIDTIYDNWEKVNGTGTSISLNNTEEAPMKINLKGNTSQATTTGKNLFYSELENGAINSADGTDSDRADLSNIRIRTKNYISVSDAQMTLSWLPSTLQCYGNCYDSSKSFLGITTGWHDTPFTFTPIQNTAYIRFVWRKSDNTAIDNTAINYNTIQLELGASQTSYEPYTNGASPNPDYPQDIHVVSGDNSIDVCGKNLFDKNNVNVKSMSATHTTVDEQWVKYANATLQKHVYIKCQPNTTYTITKNVSENANLGIYETIDEPAVGVQYRTLYYSSYSTGIRTVTTSSDVHYLDIRIGDFATLDETYYNIINTLQIEVGSQSTTYEAYKGASYPINLGVENLWNLSTTYENTTSSNKWVLNDTDVSFPPGTYTFSCNNTNSTSNSVMINFKDSNNVEQTISLTTSKTITFTNEKVKVAIRLNANTTISNIQLEKGSKQNSFTPYGTTPIELCKIGDYQDSIKKSTGKNLCNTTFELGGIDTTTGQNGSGTDRVRTKDYVEVKPNTTYTLSGVQGSRVVCFYNSSKAYLSYEVVGSQSTSGTFTTPNDTSYIRWYIIQTNTNINEMLNEGTTALPYEPYGTGWYLNKQIGKVVFNGSENWGQSGTYTNNTIYSVYSGVIDNYNNGQAISDLFVWNGSISSSTITEYIATGGDTLRIGVLKSRLNAYTIADFKTWLSTHSTIVYYVLATPTYTEITDTTLQQQLNTLEKARSYNSQTNLTQTNDDISFIITATALESITNS